MGDLLSSLVSAAPLLVAAFSAVVVAICAALVMWLRLLRARLREQRMQLPPSSQPPRPPWWHSLRPRSMRPRAAEPMIGHIDQPPHQIVFDGEADDDDDQDTPARGIRRKEK